MCVVTSTHFLQDFSSIEYKITVHSTLRVMTEVNHALSDVLEAFDDGAIQCNTQVGTN